MNYPKDLPVTEYSTTLSDGDRVKLLLCFTARGYMSKRHGKGMSYWRGGRSRGRNISRCRWGGERGGMPGTNRKSFQSINEVVQMSLCNIDSAVDVDNQFRTGSRGCDGRGCTVQGTTW